MSGNGSGSDATGKQTKSSNAMDRTRFAHLDSSTDLDLSLKEAVQIGDLETVKNLTQAMSTDSDQTGTDLFKFKSLAQIACMNGHISVLRYLVNDLGVDINSVTTPDANYSRRLPLGSSLLQISIFHDESLEHSVHYRTTNTLACVDWLTRRGANTHQDNSDGEDAFATARRTENLQALGCLSWSLLEQCSERLEIERSPWFRGSDFDAYLVVRSSRDVSSYFARSSSGGLSQTYLGIFTDE